MAVTNQDGLSEVQLTVIEPDDAGATWPSGLWTRNEVLAYMNQRQNRFLKETALLVSISTQNVDAGTERPPMPVEWIATITAAWQQPRVSGAWNPLVRADAYEWDQGQPTWTNTQSQPYAYMDSEARTLEWQLAPTPSVDGILESLYIALAAPLPGDQSTEIWTVPDEFVPYCLYGVLADMFGKEGRAKDIARAAYCESRFEEGVALGKALIEGLAG